MSAGQDTAPRPHALMLPSPAPAATTRPLYRLLTGALGAVILGAGLLVGLRPTGPVPPLGALLDPAHGAWALAARAEHATTAAADIPGLGGEVDVRYDDRGVPHIFATNTLDALRAQGYVVARDRLFQLELAARATAGELTELVGARALAVDRAARQAGFPWGAQRKMELLQQEPAVLAVLEAFADGVNAYIDRLRPADLPLEYRLLGARPRRWEAEHTMLLLVRMGQTLAWSEFELQRAELEARIGAEAVDALFPRDAWVQEPIQPNGDGAPRTRAGRLPAPVVTPAAAPLATAARALRDQFALLRSEHDGVLGSNNWAVSPTRSASGHALLANDPHLELTLPSIWYELHLVVPDSLDVYGVTIPGAPGVILGMNRDIAWGATNVGADVADYYLETVDDDAAPTRYQLDGQWQPLTIEETVYRDAAGLELARDTLRRTHRGPLLRAGDRWVSRRWLVLEPTADFDAFRQAAAARSVDEYFAVMGRFWSPAQNFIVADRGGHIGIRSTGRYPIRPDGRGDRFYDGSTRANDWLGFHEPTVAPQTRDPAQGYIASANQQPADSRDVRFYLGNEWPAPWRALHINALLRADTAVTVDAMRRYHTDPGNARADVFVPRLLAIGQARATATPADTTLARALSLLGDWDRRFTPDNERAVLFEAVMRDLARLTWDELSEDATPAEVMPERLLRTPTEDVLAVLLDDAGSAWWDRPGTAARETRDDIVAAALVSGLQAVERERGPLGEGGWRWSRIRFANIWHPLRLQPLSALELPIQAGRESLNPSSGSGAHGASWRLVAELGPTVVGRGIYPGGQSGNPVSPHYRDRIATWQRGELDSLRVPATPDALTAPHHAATLTLTPRR
jgi:penicillin G amidase